METQPLATDSTPPRPSQKRRGYDPASDLVAAKFLPLVVGISTTTAWRLRRRGLFPAPRRLTAGRIAWRRADLEQWLAERQQAGR